MHFPIERLPARRSGFRVVCAWCGLTLLEGDGEISHGLCDACADSVLSAEAVGVLSACAAGARLPANRLDGARPNDS